MDGRTPWPTTGQITQHVALEVLATLDQTDKILGQTDPKDKRLPFDLTNIPLQVEHPGGGVGRYCCHTRYLCPTHIGVILTRFMHKGSAAHIHLPTRWGVEETIEGVIGDCRYVRDSIHEVTIIFAAPVNVRLFLDVPPHYATDDATGMDPQHLSGRVLIVDDCAPDVMLLRHFLRRTNIQIAETATMGSAIDMIRTDPYDIVFCGQLIGGMPVDRVISSLRDADYTGPIVSLGEPPAGTSANGGDTLDCRAVIAKPIAGGNVLTVVNDILGDQADDMGEDGLCSTLPDDPENSALVAWYIEHIKRIMHGLQKAITADGTEEARQYLVTLRDTAPSYGYLLLGERASELITAVNACGSIAECRAQAQRLIDLSRRIRGILKAATLAEAAA